MGLKKLIKNIYFLSQISLKKEFQKANTEIDIENLIDNIQNIKYEKETPNIATIDETIKKISSEKMSLVRFGDGEFSLINKENIPFQKASNTLSFRLKEILSSSNKNIGVAIPSILYHFTSERHINSKTFWWKVGPKFRFLLSNYINQNTLYYPSEISLVSTYSKKAEEFENYFKKIKKIWENKHIHLIHGDGIFDNFEFDIFDNAKSITHQIAPSKNAFEQYDIILKNALTTEKNKLIIIILGPTATILAYDLALNGYQALDLGHIAKAYDWYKKGKDLYKKTNNDAFFKPD